MVWYEWHLHKFSGDGQTQTGASEVSSSATISLDKLIEQTWHIHGLDANSGVYYVNMQVAVSRHFSRCQWLVTFRGDSHGRSLFAHLY